MFNREKTRDIEILETAIENAFAELAGFSVDDDGYDAATTQLSKLMKLKDELTSKNRVSTETLVAVGGNLAGISLILLFERSGPVLSKALSFVTKLR